MIKTADLKIFMTVVVNLVVARWIENLFHDLIHKTVLFRALARAQAADVTTSGHYNCLLYAMYIYFRFHL